MYLAMTAKSALTLPVTKIKIPANKLIHHIPQFSLKQWLDIWNSCEVTGFLLFIQTLVEFHNVIFTPASTQHFGHVTANMKITVNFTPINQ